MVAIFGYGVSRYHKVDLIWSFGPVRLVIGVGPLEIIILSNSLMMRTCAWLFIM